LVGELELVSLNVSFALLNLHDDAFSLALPSVQKVFARKARLINWLETLSIVRTVRWHLTALDININFVLCFLHPPNAGEDIGEGLDIAIERRAKWDFNSWDRIIVVFVHRIMYGVGNEALRLFP